ncbi:DUF905 family protein [Rahnella sp. ChDrAdgB13]|uniref:DUF905 family protein n=1 Tax=Rahnella sp. ChDrAdgB13 TaxID=1850581 RepID=UPI001AD895FE|nr:DUF905 family protein [Rahnella sp. ChDrAdgB13]
MHTQNVKTAAPESSERWGESKGDLLLQYVRAQSRLKQGYALSQSEPTRDGDHQITLRKQGELVWRGWTFERDFLADFRRYIGEATEGQE